MTAGRPCFRITVLNSDFFKTLVQPWFPSLKIIRRMNTSTKCSVLLCIVLLLCASASAVIGIALDRLWKLVFGSFPGSSQTPFTTIKVTTGDSKDNYQSGFNLLGR